MATPYQIKVTAAQTGLVKVDQTDEVADKVSDLLQKDFEEHHVFFNQSGFHNHITHHLLSLFGTGATIPALSKAWDGNAGYQRPTRPGNESVASALGDWATAQQHRGNEDRYADFVLFFQKEMEHLGSSGAGSSSQATEPWQQVLLTHLFRKGDGRADDLFQRMFAGFLHPLIQLMYGVEWAQPAIVAQGLAQASVHRNKLGAFLAEADRLADEARKNVAEGGYRTGGSRSMPPIVDLLKEAGGNEKLRNAARFEDGNKIEDGVLPRAKEAALDLVKRVVVRPEELDERTAEMFYAALYMTAGAAMKEGKEPRVDFFLMHHVNAAPIHLALNAADWLPIEEKVRLLEWKIRLDLVQYIARGCPTLKFDEAIRYEPRSDEKLVGRNIDLLPRFHNVADDGHTIKLARATELCRELCQKYKDSDWMALSDEEQWARISYMVLDGSEGEGARFVRSAGFDEAWKDLPNKL